MSKLLDLVKGTPSYVLTGKALSDNPDLVKARPHNYIRRTGTKGNYRYVYANGGTHRDAAERRNMLHEYHKQEIKRTGSATGEHGHSVRVVPHVNYDQNGKHVVEFTHRGERTTSETPMSLKEAHAHAADALTTANERTSGSTSAKAHVNAKYLDSLAPEKKAKILNHVADHYGVSVAVIEDEVNDEDAENLFEYTATDPAMSMEIYNDFKRQGLMKALGDNPDLVKSGGPFIGPKGGKWADAKHTIAWKEGKPPSKQRKHAHAGTSKGWHNDHKNTTADEHRDLAGRHHKLALEASSARNKLSVRPGSSTHFEHGYDSDHHRAMADAHATMARAKDSYGGPEKHDINSVNSYLSDARAHQRNHEDSKIGSAALLPPADGKGNAATMGKTGSGNPLEFLSDANFRDHTHGWTASDHSDAAREHSARMDHQYALSDDAQRKGDFEEGARRNSAGRYHKEMAEAHEIKSRNPRKLVTPKTKRKDAKLAHSLSAPGGSMADKSAVPEGHHQIAQADGPRTVKTSHKSGLYHVHSLGGSHSVTHGPSGMSAGRHKTKAKAVAAAKHMHAVAGDAGHDAEFGKNPSKAALTRMKNAYTTIP